MNPNPFPHVLHLESQEPHLYNFSMPFRARQNLVRILAPAAALAIALAASNSLHAQFAQQPQSSAPVVPPGQVSGHVYRADTGDPLPKTVIQLIPRNPGNQGGPGRGRGNNPNDNSPELRTATTAADGSFVIADVIPSNYTIRASHSGFVASAYGQDRSHGPSTIQVLSSQDVNRIDIRLTPAGVIAGSVVDQDGDPVENAAVSAVQLRYERGGQLNENVQNVVTTDDQGSYRIFGLNPGAYLIQVNNGVRFNGPNQQSVYPLTYYPGANSTDTAQKIQVDAGAVINGIRIVLVAQQAHSIVGNIVDANGGDGRRRYNIQVSQGSTMGGRGAQVRPDGSFIVRGVTPGEYTLTAIAMNGGPDSGPGIPGYATVQVGDADATVMIEVGRVGEVRGNVMEASGQSALFVGRRLMLEPVFDPGMNRALITQGPAISTPQLDSSGGFDFKEVPPGRFNFSLSGQAGAYVKQATCSGQDYSDRPIEVNSSTMLDRCQIVLANDTGSVSGQVTDGSNALPGQIIVLVPESRTLRQVPRYTFTANSDNYGNFQIGNVVPGDYLIFATEPRDDQMYFSLDFPDQHAREATTLTIAPNQTQQANLRPINQ